jgi:hypothetical protein
MWWEGRILGVSDQSNEITVDEGHGRFLIHFLC